MIHPGILTLPGTVGRGFCIYQKNIFKVDAKWHTLNALKRYWAEIFACYVNIRKQEMSFSIGETQRKNRKAVFFRHGSRGVAMSKHFY